MLSNIVSAIDDIDYLVYQIMNFQVFIDSIQSRIVYAIYLHQFGRHRRRCLFYAHFSFLYYSDIDVSLFLFTKFNIK